MNETEMKEPLLEETNTEMESLTTGTTTEEEETTDEEALEDSEEEDSARLTSTQSSSLAQSPSTPALARFLIPLFILLTHAIFLYGQLAQMWRLRLSSHVDAWANTTTSTSRWAFDTLGLPHENHFYLENDDDVETFTYLYAVKQLWVAKGLPGKVLPRVAAILLILFSGVWPHVKLFLLTRTWLVSSSKPKNRTRVLHWLSALGKWSLADVLAVCVMVGVLNLDWHVQPDDIKAGFIGQLPSMIVLFRGIYTPTQVCCDLLKFDCNSTKVTNKAKCRACKTFVSEALSHPDWVKSTGNKILQGVSTSGGGTVQLRVLGLKGIYAFCGAVVLSVLLSLVVDVFDLRARRARRREDLYRSAQQETALLAQGSQDKSTNNEECEDPPTSASETSSGSDALVDDDEGSHHHRPLPLELQDGTDESESFQRPRVSATSSCFLKMAALLTVLLVTFAVNTPCMERRVHGAFPVLLHDVLGIEWTRSYSLRSLMARTTDASSPGWDYLLIGTFSLFVVFGPVLRATLCVVAVVVPLHHKRWKEFAKSAINFVGAFCAWEVFCVAMFMVDMLMPSITNTIYNKPSCREVSEDGSCLKVEFVFLPKFYLILVGGVMLLWTSSVAVKEEEDDKIHDADREEMAYVPLQDEEMNLEVLEQEDPPEMVQPGDNATPSL